jgi:hypothetical protein
MKKPSKKILERAKHYQYIVNGREKLLHEMDRGELLHALMNTIDLMEDLQGRIGDGLELLEKWSNTGE